jgi:hypothetical protein
MKTIGAFLLLSAAVLAQRPVLNLDKAPLVDSPGPGYRGGPAELTEVKTVNESLKADGWRLYSVKELPPGKRLAISEAARLDDGFRDSPPVYLTGDFVVAAAAADRAVLRDQRDPGLARIVAIYPREFAPPAEGSKFSRDESRPFQIQNVRRSADVIVTIYVRDVVARTEVTAEIPAARKDGKQEAEK